MRNNVVHFEIKIHLHLTLFPFKACNDNEAIEIEDPYNMSLGYSYLWIASLVYKLSFSDACMRDIRSRILQDYAIQKLEYLFQPDEIES